MNRKHGLLNSILLGLLLFTASAANAAKSPDPFEMSEQMDAIDKQDFQAAIERATSCIRGRNFTCAETELAKAARYTSGARDKAAVTQARANMHAEMERVRAEESERLARLERQRIAEEAEERRQRDRERLAERRENEAAERAALLSALGAMGRAPQPQDWLQAETQATLARIPQQIAQANRDQANEVAARQAAANRAAAERLAARQEAEAAAAQRASVRAEQAHTQRQAEQVRLAEQARRDEQVRREREAREEQRRLAEERIAAAETQRAARAKEKAELEAAKRAEAEAELRGKRDYLNKLIAGTRMAARKCPGGEGKYYIMGVFPKVTPESVTCKDVYFKATCPGDSVGVDGVGTNFLGAATDCFMGDAVKIEPLACAVEKVSVRVRDIRACGE